MKKISRIALCAMTIGASAFMVSCGDDDTTATPPVVEQTLYQK